MKNEETPEEFGSWEEFEEYKKGQRFRLRRFIDGIIERKKKRLGIINDYPKCFGEPFTQPGCRLYYLLQKCCMEGLNR